MEALLTIELFGQTYTFKTDKDKQSTQEIVEYLVNEVAKVESQQPSRTNQMTKLTTLLAAALSITNDHLQLKRSHGELVQKISQRSTRLVQALDGVVNS